MSLAKINSQSDNGKEFTADLIAGLLSLWLGVHIINGRPRHPQGLVERTDETLQSLRKAKFIINNFIFLNNIVPRFPR